MNDRLPTGLLVSALLRRANDAGGFAAVLAKGDAGAGGILVVVSVRGGPSQVFERGLGPDGSTVLIESTPAEDVDGYWQRRRSRDPDLWVIELDVADGQRFAAETIASN